jgi:hypothetical protein
MGTQRQIKKMRRSVKKAQNKVLENYMRENWDTVVRSSIALIRTFKFSIRFRLAMQILFIRRKKKAVKI